MISRLLVGLLLAGLAACRAPAVPRAEWDAVYASLLDSVAVRDSASLLLLTRQMVQPWRADSALSEAALSQALRDSTGVPPALVGGLVASLRQTPSPIGPLATRVHLAFDTLPPLSRSDRDSLMRHGQFRAGFERYAYGYPGARSVIKLSPVGFSDDGNTAIVYFENHCGMLCGGGKWIILSRRDRRWVIVQELHSWAT